MIKALHRQRFFAFLILALIVSQPAVFQFILVVNANPDWLTGWNYRKSHVINSASGAGTNYQIRIIVHYGTGTDSGEHVYLNEHCRTDFGDIRFTDDDGSTLLDYWMEEKVDGDYAVFWVEVADDLSTNSATIYIYYGKSDATTTSNGDNTFIFFDDFETGDFSKWTSSGSWQIVSNVVKQGSYAAYHAGGGTNRILSKTISFSNALVHVWARASSIGQYAGYPIIPVGNTGRSVYSMVFYSGYLKYYQSGYANWPQNNTCASNIWYRLEVGYNPSADQQKGWKDRNSMGTIPFHDDQNNQVSSLTAFQIIASPTSGYNMWIDVVYIRKWVDPEPSHGSWGNEETPPSGKVWHDTATWTFNLLTRQWISTATWTFNLLTRSWHSTATWTFNLLTRSWHSTATWTFNLLTRTWHNTALWTFTLLTRTWHDIQWNLNLLTKQWHNTALWNFILTLTFNPTLNWTQILALFAVAISLAAIGLAATKKD